MRETRTVEVQVEEEVEVEEWPEMWDKYPMARSCAFSPVLPDRTAVGPSGACVMDVLTRPLKAPTGTANTVVTNVLSVTAETYSPRGWHPDRLPILTHLSSENTLQVSVFVVIFIIVGETFWSVFAFLGLACATVIITALICIQFHFDVLVVCSKSHVPHHLSSHFPRLMP